MGRKSFICILLLISGPTAFSQPAKDTTFITVAVQNAVKLYRNALGAQARLYNGSKYDAPDHTLEQHPYFFSEDWLEGDVFYDGEYFAKIPIMFDLHNRQLITEHHPSGHAIQLVPEKLLRFSIAGHFFEKIENEAVANSLPRTGYYDILYSGETKVVAQREKMLREQIENTEIERFFEEKNRYFIFKNGVFNPVKSKSSVLKLLADKKPDLRKFLKQQRVSFSADRELAMKRLAEYYDTLK